MSIVDIKSSFTKAEPVTQWDYGQVLEIRGMDLPEGIQIHFAADGSRDAIVVVSRQENGATVADIPQALLEQPKPIIAYMYIKTSDNGKTVHRVLIPLITRQKPEDYIYTPEEKKEWEKLQEEFETLLAWKHHHLNLAVLDEITQEDLTNWSNKAEKTDIPTKVSVLENDSKYQTEADVEKTIDGKGYQTAKQVTDIIEAEGYQTEADVEKIVTGKDYQTSADVEQAITEKGYQTAENVESIVAGKGYQTAEQVQAIVANLGLVNFTGTGTELDAELERIHKEQPTNTRYQFQLRLLDMTETHSVLGKYVYFVEGWKYTNGGTYGSGRQRFATYGGEVICHKRFTGNNMYWETTLVAKDVEDIISVKDYQTSADVDKIVEGKGYQTETQVNEIVAKDTNATEKTVDFKESTTRETIASGEKLGGIFGKVAKWLTDLKTAAFSDVANDLETTEEGSVLDARQGKSLADRVGELNNLATTDKTSVVNAINELNSSTTKNSLQFYDFKGTADELDAELVRIHKEQAMHSQYKFELRLLDMTEVHSVIPKAVYYVEGWKYSNAGDYGSGEQTFKSYNQNNVYMKRFAGTASSWRTITAS